MSIKPVGDIAQIVAQEIERAAQASRTEIITKLQRIGEQAVKVARSVVSASGYLGSGTPYTVQTGNLTSSVGYCITEDGKIVVMSSFQAVGGDKGNQGADTGRKLAMQIAREFPQGYALILVAGMHYASYVQELHHRDVLASAELIAEKLVNKLKDEFNSKAKRYGN